MSQAPAGGVERRSPGRLADEGVIVDPPTAQCHQLAEVLDVAGRVHPQ
jgi:hypothetical protein